MYYRDDCDALLIVYVDDFKIASPTKDHDRLWAALRAVIELGPEASEERFLGCEHESFECNSGKVRHLLELHPSYHPRPHLTKEDCNGESAKISVSVHKKVREKDYNMQNFVEQCVDSYCDHAKFDKGNLKMCPRLVLRRLMNPVA